MFDEVCKAQFQHTLLKLFFEEYVFTKLLYGRKLVTHFLHAIGQGEEIEITQNIFIVVHLNRLCPIINPIKFPLTRLLLQYTSII